MLEKHPDVIKVGKKNNTKDLLDDWVIQFQIKLYPWWDQFWCFIVPGLYGMWRINCTFLTSVLIFGFSRWCISAHITFCINSIAHTFGYKPYNKDISARENVLASLLTSEGWHNWHHIYPWDYAASEYNWFRQWNPAKLFIDFGYLIGQTYDLKRKNNS